MSNMLTLSNIEFRVGKKRILSGLSFTVPTSCVFAVVGHNGAGKTTLFHLFLGIKTQSSGTIELNGKSNLDFLSRSSLGYVPERPYLNLDLQFRELLNYHAKLAGIPQKLRMSEVERVANEVGLGSQLDFELKTFSKGMLQKAVLAQASIGDPNILILDEPMSGLDPEAREAVRQRIEKWKLEGKTIIFSSHALEDVEMLASQVMILTDGKIEFLGSVKSWKERKL